MKNQNNIIHFYKRNEEKTNTIRIRGKTIENNYIENPIKGTVSLQGSKNAALPIIAATILLKKTVTLKNVPDISDIHHLLKILETIGAKYEIKFGTLAIDTSEVKFTSVENELTNKIRASSLLLGPMLSVFGHAEIGIPGGCSIGNRPLNYHLEALESLGAEIIQKNNYIAASVNELEGDFTLPFPSVGATQNLITASVLRAKKVVIRNIAIEPEVKALIDFLVMCGANIKFIETNAILIEKVPNLKPLTFTIPSDRIEAGTLLAAGFLTKGDVEVININYNDIAYPLQTLIKMGAKVTKTAHGIRVAYQNGVRPLFIETSVFPGFPTDLQSIWSVVLTQANGTSVINENIFNNRFQHLEEMSNKMNLTVHFKTNQAFIENSHLLGAEVEGKDLRGTAALILAGLVAEGETLVKEARHLHRGYELLVEKLKYLGADINYVKRENVVFKKKIV